PELPILPTRSGPASRRNPTQDRTFGFGAPGGLRRRGDCHATWHPLCVAPELTRSGGPAPGLALDHPRRLAMSRRCTPVLFVCSLLAAVGGCHGQPGQVAPSQPPAVPVSRPVQQEVTDYVEFTGRTDAVQAVNIEARVTGYLVRMPFKE